ncbi:MAG: DUF4340 domain-containing protein [Bacteroidetes bacterium]|jgi:hypothetical protein|nr:DUF4340 domain-containing protein [Bacteroidota bacterium]
MKNQRIALVLLALLAVLAIAYYLSTGTGTGLRPGHFAVTDTNSIQQIVLRRHFARLAEDEVVTLVKKDSTWWANDLYRANPARIRELMQAIATIQAREPVESTARANAMRYIRETHVRVEVQTQDSTRIYYVGPGSPDKRGSLAYLEDDEIPYIVELPGFVGNVDRHYATRLKEWRQLPLFTLGYEDLRQIAVRYPGADSSYVLRRQPNGMWKLPDQPTDTTASLRYARQYKPTYALEPAEERYPGAFEALARQRPDVVLQLTDKAGRKQTLNLHYIAGKPDLLLGWKPEKPELLLVQNFSMAPYLARRHQFVAR